MGVGVCCNFRTHSEPTPISRVVGFGWVYPRGRQDLNREHHSLFEGGLFQCQGSIFSHPCVLYDKGLSFFE